MSVVVADGSGPPIDKACGEGLMPETIAALGELGVTIRLDACYRFRGIRLLPQDAQAGGDLPQGLGIGIRRTILHEWLIARAQECGVQLMWRAPVSGITEAGVHLVGKFVGARGVWGARGR